MYISNIFHYYSNKLLNNNSARKTFCARNLNALLLPKVHSVLTPCQLRYAKVFQVLHQGL